MNRHQARRFLLPAYVDYCQNVSLRSMAISIETASLILSLCPGKATACDLGSGFSSYVLRLRCGQVDSVDDSPEWLDQTRGFLTRYDQSTGDLWLWDDWLARPRTYDLIVHDFSAGIAREAAMWTAAERLNPGGVLIFDDAQHDGHRAVMHKVAKAHGLELRDVRAETIDAKNRYALMATRPLEVADG